MKPRLTIRGKCSILRSMPSSRHPIASVLRRQLERAAWAARVAVLLVLMISALLATGCTGSVRKQGLLEKTTPEALIDSATLRAWTYDFTLNFADRVQDTADRIAAESSDIEVRRNALRWKISATQAGLRAASRRDALAAMGDVWILCRQMTVFFETGPGRSSFGSHQPLAIDACNALEGRIELFAQSILRPEQSAQRLAQWRTYVDEFAAAFPIESLTFIREPLSGRAGVAVAPPPTRLAEVAGGLQADVNALQRLLAATAEYTPIIALWQAQLMLLDADRLPAVAEALATLRSIPVELRQALREELGEGMTPAIRQVFGEDFARIAAGETDKAISMLQREREAMIEQVERMRTATLEFIAQERAAVIAEVDRQRLATVDYVRSERKAALEEANVMLRQAAESATGVGDGLIDRLVTRLSYLLGAFTAALIVVAGVFLVIRAAMTKTRRA